MKRRMTKTALLVFALIIVGAVVFGAGAKEGAKPAGPASLRFSWWGNDVRHKATLDAIDNYMSRYDDVQIVAEYRGKSEREKIATELAGGTVADLVQLNPPWMGDFTAAGDFFVDLNEYSDVLDFSGFSKQFVEDYGVYNGKLIGLPMGLNARTAIINVDLAKQFGIPTSLDTTWTWDDFYEIGKTVNAKDSSKYFLNADTVDITEFLLLPYLVQRTGNQLIQDDYTRGFSEAQLQEVFQYIGKLYRDNVVIPVQEGNVFLHSIWTNPRWLKGDIVLEFSWTSLFSAVSSDMAAEAATFILPVHQNAKNTGLIITPSQLLSISSKSKYPREAAEFMNFFFNDIEAGKILGDARAIPPVDRVQAACQEAGLINEHIIAATEYAQKNQGLYRNDLSGNAEIVKTLNDAVEKVAYNPSSANAVATETVRLIDYILSELQE